MSRHNNSGMLVRTKSGNLGRTFSHQLLIKGKIRVYKVTETKKLELPSGPIEVPTKWNQAGALCDPKTLELIGYLD